MGVFFFFFAPRQVSLYGTLLNSLTVTIIRLLYDCSVHLRLRFFSRSKARPRASERGEEGGEKGLSYNGIVHAVRVSKRIQGSKSPMKNGSFVTTTAHRRKLYWMRGGRRGARRPSHRSSSSSYIMEQIIKAILHSGVLRASCCEPSVQRNNLAHDGSSSISVCRSFVNSLPARIETPLATQPCSF